MMFCIESFIYVGDILRPMHCRMTRTGQYVSSTGDGPGLRGHPKRPCRKAVLIQHFIHKNYWKNSHKAVLYAEILEFIFPKFAYSAEKNLNLLAPFPQKRQKT